MSHLGDTDFRGVYELTLDDINIPHGQWTLTFVLSHGLIEQFNEPKLGVVCYRSKEIVPYCS